MATLETEPHSPHFTFDLALRIQAQDKHALHFNSTLRDEVSPLEGSWNTPIITPAHAAPMTRELWLRNQFGVLSVNLIYPRAAPYLLEAATWTTLIKSSRGLFLAILGTLACQIHLRVLVLIPQFRL